MSDNSPATSGTEAPAQHYILVITQDQAKALCDAAENMNLTELGKFDARNHYSQAEIDWVRTRWRLVREGAAAVRAALSGPAYDTSGEALSYAEMNAARS